MKEIKTMMLIVLAITIGFTVCSCRPRIKKQPVKPRPQLRFNTQQFPPFCYEENGVAAGPVTEIIQNACDKVGIECHMSVMKWETSQQQVKDGLADGLYVMGWNASRANWFYFSPPLLQTEYGFFARKKLISDYSSISDLKGKTVGVQGPSNMSKTLSRIKMQLNGDMDVRVFGKLQSCFNQMVKDESVDLVFANKDVGKFCLKALGDYPHDIQYIGRYHPLQYYICVSKQVSRKLFDNFNNGLQALQRDGTTQKILEAHGLSTPSRISCNTVLRRSASVLSEKEMNAMRRRLNAEIYNAEWFNDLSCSYDQRFTPHGSGVVVDNAINVMWEISPTPKRMTWRQSNERMAALNRKQYGGYRNWRLPTIEELYSVIIFGEYGNNYFIDRITKGHKMPFWSIDRTRALQRRWVVDFIDGGVAPADNNEWLGVIAVRTMTENKYDR